MESGWSAFAGLLMRHTAAGSRCPAPPVAEGPVTKTGSCSYCNLHGFLLQLTAQRIWQGLGDQHLGKLANELVHSVHDEDTFLAVSSERALLKALEGGCQVPIGAYAQIKTEGLHLCAMVGSLDGSICFRKERLGPKDEPEALGKAVARDLLIAGADKILKEIFEVTRCQG